MDNSEKKAYNVPFKLISITTEQFADFKSNYQANDDKFDIAMGVNIKNNLENRIIGMFTRFEFFQKKQPILVVECACHFAIEESYWVKQTKGALISFDKDFLTHLLVLTVGTARGIIHAKKPFWLQALILPTFNVSNYIEEDMQLSLAFNEEE